VAGVDCALAQTLTDEALEARLYRRPWPGPATSSHPTSALVHQELKRPGVTLQLLWEEYAAANALAYKYTSFCVKYRAWAKALKRSMRQTHMGPARSCSSTTPARPCRWSTPATGEITPGADLRGRAGRVELHLRLRHRRQTTADWIGAQVQALEFIGGVPRLIVPDQARALIKRPDRYDPSPSAAYEEFATTTACAVLPARPAHPRDKPKVEVGVLVVERWILARLRNRRFFSLAELNKAIGCCWSI
jgi:transposase